MSDKPVKLPKASHRGLLPVGHLKIPVFVLDGGVRVITQRGLQTTVGMSTSGGTSGAHRTANILMKIEDRLSIDNELSTRMKSPLVFKPTTGGMTAYGYEATTLIDICELILKGRDNDKLLPSQEKYATASDIVIRAFAKVGIIAVIDEVTGYQEIRDRDALEKILDKYLRKELAAWAKRFPDEFYQQMFRLRGWQWRGLSVKRPSVVGHFTNDLVYERIAPDLLTRLQERNPKDEKGHRKARHHQWLTEDLGIPALAEHLHAVIGLMRASAGWDQFYRLVQRAFPRLGTNLLLPIDELEQET